jgi:predicted phosphodiesterase
MIYVTGDMHGDLSRFRRKSLRRLKKGDTLIVCGDFGFVFDGSEKERRILKWIGRRRFQVLFVEGLHDNLNLLEGYPAQDWNGGQARQVSGNLRHLCRGHIFTIEGKSILAFGGGETSALEGVLNWWEHLLPSPREIEETRGRLAARGNTVDYIVTHQCSRRLKRLLTAEETDINVLETFFDELRAGCKFKGWFFAGYHFDRFIPPCEAALFEEVAALGETVEMSNTNAASRARKR